MRHTWLLLVVLALLGVLVAGDGDKETDHSHHANTHDDKTDGDSENAGKEFAKDEHHEWTYNIEPEHYGASKWNTLFAEKCGSVMKHQSPIDIVQANTKHVDDLGTFDILFPEVEAPETKKTEDPTPEAEGQPELETSHKGLEEAPADSGMRLFNNGHTVQVDVTREILVVGGGLGSQYKVAQFHFHWGKDGTVGSEHRIDGNMFMLEMHIVTFDSERFSNLGEAVGQENGIAVLGILFKGGKHNDKLNNVVNNLKNLQGLNQKMPIEWFDIREVLPAKPENFFRYTGSLTTPPCSETVRWTVFAEHQTICPNQMKQFYNMTEGFYADGSPVKLVNNWRPPQPLNGRTVQASFTTEEKLVEYNVYNNGDANASSRALSNMLVLALCMCLALLRS